MRELKIPEDKIFYKGFGGFLSLLAVMVCQNNFPFPFEQPLDMVQ